MLKRLLKGTDFAQLLDMVSPAFFEVLPPKELWRQGRELKARYKSQQIYMATLSDRASRLERADIGVRIGSVAGGEPEITDPKGRGQALLRLYFHQVLDGGPALLDVRSERFGRHGDSLLWDPSRLSIEWEPEFQAGIREMYAGFYRGDDGRFTGALDALNLRCAEETFRNQFGTGDQRAVTFEMKQFIATFHQAFVSCRDRGDALHRNFMGLGIYLAFLYDHLESLGGGPFDVRAAYFAAAGEPVSEAA